MTKTIILGVNSKKKREELKKLTDYSVENKERIHVVEDDLEKVK